MSFDRPGLDKHQTVTDTDLNDALEGGEPDESLLNADQIEHDDGQRSPGPVDEDNRRPPEDQDVTSGDQGAPIEPPD
ncbi:hypothetical protein [Kribbella sp. CA-293567]|uniref:hypothetical protein n=1 Tax=Kribbella sp. CA-293567 TaxID=3002436 RepID=UPI0022DD32F8|nr:hypothetical protein [Kribbella sp. CA-293567]WBQ03507.1 hypothetical protein OX958_26470 [Kribbella sp. CA-293567]